MSNTLTVGRWALAYLLLTNAACAGGLAKTIDVTEAAMVGLDVVIDESADVWAKFVEREIERCRALDLETPEERSDCLGAAANAPDVKAALESVVKAQEAMAEALKAVRGVAPMLEEAKD